MLSSLSKPVVRVNATVDPSISSRRYSSVKKNDLVLPREIIILILKELTALHTDRVVWQQWLASCALVSYEWYVVASEILWEVPEWNNSHQLYKCIESIQFRSLRRCSSHQNEMRRLYRGPECMKSFSCLCPRLLNDVIPTHKFLSHLCEAALDLESLALPRLTSLQDTSLYQITTTFGHSLVSVDLSYCRLITDECIKVISQILRPHQQLSKLSLRGVSKLKDSGLISLGQCLSGCLKFVDISECSIVSDVGLITFAQLCKNGPLETFRFGKCTRISRNAIVYALNALSGSKLKFLEFDCPSASSRPFKSFPIQQLTNISKLHITNARDLFDDQLKQITVTLAPQLEELSLNYAIHMTLPRFHHLLESLQNVRHVCFQRLPFSVQQSLSSSFSASPILCRIEYLDLSGNIALDGQSLGFLFSDPTPMGPARLRYFSVSDCINIPIRYIQTVVRCLWKYQRQLGSTIFLDAIDMTNIQGAAAFQKEFLLSRPLSIPDLRTKCAMTFVDREATETGGCVTEWERISILSDQVGLNHHSKEPRFTFVLKGKTLLTLFANHQF